MKKEIKKEFVFTDFAAAMVFVDEVTRLAESVQHHPDILVQYNKVTLTLSTHDAGGVTEKDLALEKKIDAISS